MKTNDRFSNLKNVKSVTKLNQAAYNMLAVTTNYSLFKHNTGNRNGLQAKRVKDFVKKINENRFYPTLGKIIVGKDGTIYEGNHRFEAFVLTNKPVVFMIAENFTLNEIADYNTSRSSAWKNDDLFGSAKTENAELAKIFDALRDDLLTEFTLLNKTKLNIGDFYGILTEDLKWFGGKYAVPREMYFSKTFISKARSIEFEETLNTYAYLRQRFVDKHKNYKITKVIMECTFTKNNKVVGFNLDTFRKNMENPNVDFKTKETDVTKDFVREIVRIHNIGLSKKVDKAMIR